MKCEDLRLQLPDYTLGTHSETEMAAVGTRHQFEDGVALPVAPAAEHDPFIAPLHLVLRELEPHPAVAFRVLAPALAHLDEQK